MTDENLSQLLNDLHSDDLKTRYMAAFELTKRNHTEGISLIVEYINQRHFQYLDSYMVVNQLAEVQDERVTEALIGLLDMKGSHVVGNALNSLLAIGDERGVDAVSQMLMTPSPWYGWGTAQLIAKYDKRYLPRLLQVRRHENPLMRARVAHALQILASGSETLLKALEDDEDIEVVQWDDT